MAINKLTAPEEFAELDALRAKFDKMEQALKEVRIPVTIAIFEFIRDCAKNWDHDTDGHRYDTGCRMCDAKSLYEDLKKKKEALDEQPTIPQQGAVTEDAHEKEVMMKAFDDVRKIFEGRAWIMEGRGSYTYNDDRYKEEVRYLYNEFDAIQKATWAKIKSKSVDYRHQIIADYLNENKQQGAVWVNDADQHPTHGWCGKVRTVNRMGELNEREATWFPGWEIIGGTSDEYVSEWLDECGEKEVNNG
jgi:hypothetical protein